MNKNIPPWSLGRIFLTRHKRQIYTTETVYIWWPKLHTIRTVHPGGCDWVTFASITECINNNHFEDSTLPQTKLTHHAARIADLVNKIQNHVEMDPIHINVRTDIIKIYDGSHRFRAYQYRNQFLHKGPWTNPVKSIVSGQVEEVLNNCLAMPYTVNNYTYGF